MQRYRQFQPLNISDVQFTNWPHPPHNHNHYEIIYIWSGIGHHIINGLTIPYFQGDIFLVGPEEVHYFEIQESTRFIYIKFTDLYIYQKDNATVAGMQYLEYLIKSRETHLSAFKLKDSDEILARVVINTLLAMKQDLLSNERLIWLQVLSLVIILYRNMPELKATSNRTQDMQAVFCYVHKNIYYPERLKAPLMAAHFYMSSDYIGPYFKRNTGMTLRDYIGAYRRKLMEGRVASGNYSLKQIANEFGLADESHASKLLKG